MQLSLRTRVLLILFGTAAVSVLVSVAGFLLADGEFKGVRAGTDRSIRLYALMARLDESVNSEFAAARDYVLAVGRDEAAAQRASNTWHDEVQTETATYLPDSASATTQEREGRFRHWLFADPLSPAATADNPDCGQAFGNLRALCRSIFDTGGVRRLNCLFRGGECTGGSGWALRVLQLSPAQPLEENLALEILKYGQDDFAPVKTELDRVREDLAAGVTLEINSKLDSVSAIQGGFPIAGILVAVAMLLVSYVLISRWVAQPLNAMVRVARTVEAGGEASFGLGREDEIGQLGSALETMRVRMSEQRAAMAADARVAGIINRFTDAAAFALDETDLGSAVLEALADLTDARDCVVHIAAAGREKANMEAQSGGVSPGDIPIGVMDNCPGVRRGSMYTTPDLAHALTVRCPVYRANTGALACIPITAGGEAIGAVHLHWGEPRSIPLPIRTAIARITDHAGMAIANSRLIAAMRGQSVVDVQTGLPNTAAFDEALDRALAARRQGHPLSVLLLDVDNFSTFNDRNGTPAGDDALRFFARTLLNTLRESDVAGRYGPEEFAVCLPDMSGGQAREIAERIRSKLEATVLPVGRDTTERLTVSIGVAAAPDDGLSRVALLRAADVALHEAKISGRNRVVAAAEVTVEDEHDVEDADSAPIRGHMIAIARVAAPAAGVDGASGGPSPAASRRAAL